MKYLLSYRDPHKHLLDIELRIEGGGEEEMMLQFPSWRPGRYKLGDFARNLYKLETQDEKGNFLEHEKVTKDQWVVKMDRAQQLHVRYQYYANVMDAGSSYLDDHQLYVNPVSCFLYAPGREEERTEVELKVPGHYKVATAMAKTGEHEMEVDGLQELMDSPFIASPSLIHDSWEVEGVLFHLWFQGPCKPELDRIKADFTPFIQAQIKAFGDFPVEEYHFFYQVLPYPTFHGVEHCNSTVITLGPSYDLMKEEGGKYDAFVGVSSHELYHTWNIKQIRPAAMLPYDFSRENYTRLGYVAEGVTTYMGDQMLVRSGVMPEQKYFKKLSTQLKRHFDNPGRFNLSVAESSFDTWLDGYDQEVPFRKVSIYNEGALISLMMDVKILKATHGERSLDEVMKILYHSYAKKGKGIDEKVLYDTLEQVAERSFEVFFRKFVWGTTDYRPELEKCLSAIGLELIESPSKEHHETLLGFKVLKENERWLVSHVLPGSLADLSGLAMDDELVAINGYRFGNTVKGWVEYFNEEQILQFHVFRNGVLELLELEKPSHDDLPGYRNYKVEMVDAPDPEQQKLYEVWLNR